MNFTYSTSKFEVYEEPEYKEYLNFTYSTSKFEVFEEPEYKEYWRSRIGYPLSQEWGFLAERLFLDDAEAKNSPSQLFGGEYGGGDIKYTDVNGDGDRKSTRLNSSH